MFPENCLKDRNLLPIKLEIVESEIDQQNAMQPDQQPTEVPQGLHHCNCEKMNELLLEKINLLVNEVQALKQKIDSLSSTVSYGHNMIASQNLLQDLPVASDDKLNYLEKFLAYEENRKDFVVALRGIGGSNMVHVIKNVLKKIFSNNVAELYSWAGKQGKKPFKNLLVAQVILEATRLHFPKTTEEECSKVIANWLRHAKGRRERRKLLYS